MSRYKKIEGYYDDYGTWYDDERIEGYYSFINDIETEIVRAYGCRKKTLEIGCGTGIVLKKVASFARDAWGIDLSEGMLERAREKGLNVVHGNATKLPFKDEEFDVVYSFKVLAHIPDIEKVIDESLRVVNKNGYVIFEFYNPWSFKFLNNRLAGSFSKVYTRYDSLRGVRKLFSGKLEIVGVRGARIITPAAFFMRIPIIREVLIYLEKALSSSILRRFAGYLIVIARPIVR